MIKNHEPHVLIIDDEVQLTRSLKEKLEDEGYEVQVCADYSTARSMISHQKFCCIVIDQKLKGGTGDMIIAEIRKTPLHRNYETPILYMSAHLSEAFLKRIGSAVDSILIKPFGRAEFAEKVKDLCPVED